MYAMLDIFLFIKAFIDRSNEIFKTVEFGYMNFLMG